MAVRCESGEYLSRTANLPPLTGFTLCAWGMAGSTITSGSWRQFLSIGATGGNQIGAGNDNEGSSNNWGIVNNAAAAHSSFGTAPAANVPFFMALVTNGTGAGNVTGYYRLGSSVALTQASAIASSSFTVNSVRVADSVFDGTDYFDGMAWNVKCWDRALTAAELLVESYYRRVMFPSSINFHWPLDIHTNTNDYSGNGRAATVTGTISTVDGSLGLWRPRRTLFIPAAEAGGEFQAAWARNSNTVLMPSRA